jgi:hypothetical protein
MWRAMNNVRGPSATDKRCRGILGDLNDVTFYAFQPPPPPNDVTFYAYQPNNIAINVSGVKKNEIGFSQNNLSIRVWSVWLEFLLPLKTN